MVEKEYEKILEKFALLPKKSSDPSFMEISHLVGDRFEEHCSKILQFYLNPKKPHGLNTLFLNSLLELLPEDNFDNRYNYRTVQVRTEETTEDGKRIDIIIETESFIVAIENKIGASLYNPLESYVAHIESNYRNKEKKYFVVLSARPITSCSEKKLMRDNNYCYINYQQFFENIKSNVGRYIQTCNQTYLCFAFDFIKTIENKYNNVDMETKRFFYENKDKIEELIERYNNFTGAIFTEQCNNISAIKNLLYSKTNVEWWIYKDWDLGITFNIDGNRIGIESNFANSSINNPLGDFHIYITVWKKQCFEPYRNELKQRFPDCWIDENPENAPNRIYLHLPVISDGNNEIIADKLSEYYLIMKEITERIK